jgi:hypothetical protein
MALHLALVIAGTALAFWPTLRSGFDRMQTDPGDTVYLSYALEHGMSALLRRDYVGSFWSPPFFHPAPDVLAYSESLLGTLPVYALLRTALPPDTAYQVWCIAMLALSYAAMAWALRRLELPVALSGLGAFVFAYGLQRVSHLGHGQLLPAAFAPLAIVALAKHVREPDRRLLAGFLLASVLQVAAGIYLGWFLILGCGLFGGLLLSVDRVLLSRQLRFLRENVGFTLGALLAWSGSLLLLLRPYLVVARELPPRPWADVLLLLPRPRSWIAAPTGSLWAKLGDIFPPETPLVWEHRIFLGAVPCLLGMLGLLAIRGLTGNERSRKTLVIASLGTVFALWALSLRVPVKTLGITAGEEAIEYLTLWRLVYEIVPGATSIRAVGRVWTILLPLLLIGGLLGLDTLLARVRSARRRAWLTASLVAFGLVEQFQGALPSFDKLEHRTRVEKAREVLAGSGCDAAYFHLDPSQPFFSSQLVAMWAGLEANVPVVNGYSGNFPPGYPDPTRSMTSLELSAWLPRAPRGRYCVVGTASPAEMGPLRILETGRIPDRRLEASPEPSLGSPRLPAPARHGQ